MFEIMLKFGAPFAVNAIVAILKRWISTKWAPLIVFVLGGLSTLIGVGPAPGGEWVDMIINTAFVSGGATLMYDLYKKLFKKPTEESPPSPKRETPLNGKVISSFILVMVLIFSFGCATIQEKWDKLTPDEQKRVILNGLQTEFNDLFKSAAKFVADNETSHPEYLVQWIKVGLPACETTNQAIRTAIIACKSGGKSLDEVWPEIKKLIEDLQVLLNGIGIKIKISRTMENLPLPLFSKEG